MSKSRNLSHCKDAREAMRNGNHRDGTNKSAYAHQGLDQKRAAKIKVCLDQKNGRQKEKSVIIICLTIPRLKHSNEASPQEKTTTH